MPTILLTIFFVQLSIHLLNTIGASAINELLWTLYTSLPLRLSSSSSSSASGSRQSLHAQQSQLRAEVVRLKRDMASTSAQDNFAKWAKIRREHDRALQNHDEIAAKSSSFRSQFNTYASSARWISTNGLRMFLQFWYARTPVFRLPGAERGWVPGWVEWVVGFPRAQGKGGVSVQVWGSVCVVVIGLVSEGLVWAVEEVVRLRGEGMGKAEGMKMGSNGGDGVEGNAEKKSQ